MVRGRRWYRSRSSLASSTRVFCNGGGSWKFAWSPLLQAEAGEIHRSWDVPGKMVSCCWSLGSCMYRSFSEFQHHTQLISWYYLTMLRLYCNVMVVWLHSLMFRWSSIVSRGNVSGAFRLLNQQFLPLLGDLMEEVCTISCKFHIWIPQVSLHLAPSIHIDKLKANSHAHSIIIIDEVLHGSASNNIELLTKN